jgi:hypothetical protein
MGRSSRLMKPSVQEWQSPLGAVRKDQVTLKRLQIGPTRLTHGPLLGRQPAPDCAHCGVPLTVANVLVGGPAYAEARCICHLDDVIFDILGDNPCWTSNVLAFVAAFGPATTI